MERNTAVGPGTRILVLSPHLDDAVLSVGAFVATAVAVGAKVEILTIFAGDPDSTAAAGRWDARAGFETAAEATHVRRAEDRRACAALGADYEWLPYLDKDYGPPPDEDAVWAHLSGAVHHADVVFAPGRPLIHLDHAWVSHLVAERADPAKLVFYAELPYDVWPDDRTDGARAVKLATARRWTAPRAGLRARRLKWRASSAYSTQLPWLAQRGYRVAVLRSRLGCERLAWPA
jgi:LmbE family N-acetylglucosaminyl deacetylase